MHVTAFIGFTLSCSAFSFLLNFGKGVGLLLLLCFLFCFFVSGCYNIRWRVIGLWPDAPSDGLRTCIDLVGSMRCSDFYAFL